MAEPRFENGPTRTLPSPEQSGTMSLHDAISRRRSHREFSHQPVDPAHLARLCWAAQGVTNEHGMLRASPSAGGVYPMTILVADANGIFEYEPNEHVLRQTHDRDVRKALQRGSLNQSCVGDAPLCLAVVYEATTLETKYGDDAERYALLEAGHIAQNILLQATADGLSGVPVGAFHVEPVARSLRLAGQRKPVYLVPLGYAVAT